MSGSIFAQLLEVGGMILSGNWSDSGQSSSSSGFSFGHSNISSSDYDSDYSAQRHSSSRKISRNYERGRQVAATTGSYLLRYEQTLNDMLEQGLDKYVRDDFDNLMNMLEQAKAILDETPFQARDISLQIGARIAGLPRLARELRRGINASEEVERREEERQGHEKQIQEAKERQAAMRAEEKAALEYIDKTAQTTFADAVEQDIVRKEIKALKMSFESQVVGSDNIKEVLASFDRELSALHKSAQEKAEAWREKKRNEQSVDAVEDTITNAENVIKQHSKPEVSEELASLQSSLGKLKEDFRAGIITAEQVTSKVIETQDAVTETLTTEALRRETLKAIVAITTKLGFIMNGKPKLLNDGNVRISLRRPGGEECTFLVSAEGGMKYTFDGYQGMACKKDIGALKKQLSDVYGVHFSNERVIWQNPDEIGKSSVNNSESIKGEH